MCLSVSITLGTSFRLWWWEKLTFQVAFERSAFCRKSFGFFSRARLLDWLSQQLYQFFVKQRLAYFPNLCSGSVVWQQKFCNADTIHKKLFTGFYFIFLAANMRNLLLARKDHIQPLTTIWNAPFLVANPTKILTLWIFESRKLCCTVTIWLTLSLINTVT